MAPIGRGMQNQPTMASPPEVAAAATGGARSVRANDATRAVQLGAAVLLGGGFYYGYTKQQKVAEKVRQADARRAEKGIKPRESVARAIRPPTLFERQLGLDRPQPPGSAAFRALLGGTIAALTGATVVLLGVGAVVGATNPTEFRDRMEDVLPRLRKNVTDSLGIKPTSIHSEFDSEEAELDHLSQIFESAMQQDLEAEHLKQKQQQKCPQTGNTTEL